MSALNYVYVPLENPQLQIRLLKVEPTRKHDSVIDVNMSAYTISSGDSRTTKTAKFISRLKLPSYIALSHVWGTGSDLDKTHDINIGGRRLLITANIYDALISVRAIMHPLATFIWIDSICINQTDEQEKSAQVQLMREIYSLSNFIFVWLGLANEESDEIFGFIEFLHSKHGIRTDLTRRGDRLGNTQAKTADQKEEGILDRMKAGAQRAAMNGSFSLVFGAAKFVQGGLSVLKESERNSAFPEVSGLTEADIILPSEQAASWRPSPRAMEHIASYDLHNMGRLIEKSMLMETQYFDRMWTLQEACVGMLVLLVCGHRVMYLSSFLNVVNYLRSTHGIKIAHTDPLCKVQRVNDHWFRGFRLPLTKLLYYFRERQSKDPRDRIYALHGLMSDFVTSFLIVDYSKSVDEVYANTTKHLLFSSKCLNAICGHQPLGKLPGLPSWTPDYRLLDTDALAGPLTSLDEIGDFESLYHASFPEKYAYLDNGSPALPQPWHILPTQGIIIDIISTISEPEQRFHDFEAVQNKWLQALIAGIKPTTEETIELEIISKLVALYNDFHNSSDKMDYWHRNPEALSRMHRLVEAYKDGTSTANMYYRYMLVLICGRKDRKTRCDLATLGELVTCAGVGNAVGDEVLNTLCKAIEAGMQSRRLIVTSQGKVGAAPETSQVGDLVCVLIGCSVPVILRKLLECDEYMLVGESYMTGYLDGEAIKERDNGTLTMQEFPLR